MKILVTGGSGMLGSRLARQLLADGADVRITYLPGDMLRAVEELSVEHRPADILDERAMLLAMEGCTAVFHTAAMVTFQPRLYHRQWQVNVQGTRNVIAGCCKLGVRRLIYTSTVNTLGRPLATHEGDEDTPFDWQPYRMGYMDSKYAAEQEVLKATHDGLDAVCLLPGTMFGPGDVNANAGRYVQWVARWPMILAPPGGTSVVHVDDVVAGHILAWQKGQSGRRYALAGEALSYRDLFCCIAQQLGRPEVRWTLPPALLTRLARILGLVQAHVPVTLPLTEGILVAAGAPLYYSSKRAAKELGWSYRPAEQAIAAAISWYRQQGWL